MVLFEKSMNTIDNFPTSTSFEKSIHYFYFSLN